MSRSPRKPKEMTRKDYERITERYYKRVEPYLEKIQVDWILEEMDRKQEALKKSKLTHEDDRNPSKETIERAGHISNNEEEGET